MLEKLVRKLRGFKSKEEEDLYKETYQKKFKEKRTENLIKQAEKKAELDSSKSPSLTIQKLAKGMDEGMKRMEGLVVEKVKKEDEHG